MLLPSCCRARAGLPLLAAAAPPLSQLLLMLVAATATQNHPATAAAAAAPPGTKVPNFVDAMMEEPNFSLPRYEDTSGSFVVDVTAPHFQAGVNKLQILLPSGKNPTAAPVRGIVLALPVEAGGTSTKQYGSCIGIIRQHGWATASNMAVVTPAFSTTPWFADRGGNSTLPAVRQESYIVDVIVPWLRSGGNGSLPSLRVSAASSPLSLIGFSKSGWGAFTLWARNPEVFSHGAAMWDTPSMLSEKFCDWLLLNKGGNLWDMMQVMGNCSTWGRYSPFEIVSRGLTPPSPEVGRPKLWLGGQHYFGAMAATAPKGKSQPPGSPFSHTVDFHALLQRHSVLHEFNDNLDPGKHEWSWVWMARALEFLSPTRDGLTAAAPTADGRALGAPQAFAAHSNATSRL